MPSFNATEEASWWNALQSLPLDAEKKQFLQHDTKFFDDLA